MNNKLTLTTKKSNAIFLAIVLIAGTIATLLSQSSFIVGAQAQPHYNGGMDDNITTENLMIATTMNYNPYFIL